MRTLPSTLLLWLSALLVLAPAGHSQQLELKQGDTICLLGGAVAERMQHDGWLELALQARFSDLDLRVRNLGFAGDSLMVRQRTMNLGKFSEDGLEMTLQNEGFTVWDRYLEHCEADVVFAFLGFNDSFAGEEGLPQFKKDLQQFVRHITRPNGASGRRLVLVGPVPIEQGAGFQIEAGLDENLARYGKVLQEVAAVTATPFVSLRKPLLEEYEKWSKPLTLNGVHPSSQLNMRIAQHLERELFGEWMQMPFESDRNDQNLLAAIKEKNQLWFNRYRATDGYNVYGDRSRRVYAGHSNFDVLQR
ncbi:MAG: SGNH/GDSL hydrolase family protein, partial [Planctomycetota bacterium]